MVRGAQCNTDHMTVKVKVQVGRKPRRSRQERQLVGKFDVSRLQGENMDERGRKMVRGKFVDKVCEQMKEGWCSDGTVEEKWGKMKAALCEAAGSVLGTACRRQGDWFEVSGSELRLEERGRLQILWLSTGRERDKKKFVNAHRIVRQTVREAKNAWFQKKALEAERGWNGGKIVWHCIKSMQHGRRGLVPVRMAVIRDENGNSCSSLRHNNRGGEDTFQRS